MPTSLSFNLLGTRMVKRASFCILAELEVLQSSTHLLIRKREDEDPQYLQGQENSAADQREWQSRGSGGRERHLMTMTSYVEKSSHLLIRKLEDERSRIFCRAGRI